MKSFLELVKAPTINFNFLINKQLNKTTLLEVVDFIFQTLKNRMLRVYVKYPLINQIKFNCPGKIIIQIKMQEF